MATRERTTVVTTTAEKQEIVAAAEQAGMDTSSWLKMVALAAARDRAVSEVLGSVVRRVREAVRDVEVDDE